MSATSVEAAPLCRVGGALLEGPSWEGRRSRLLLVDILGAEALTYDWSTGLLSRTPVSETCSAWMPRTCGGSALVGRTGVRLLDAAGALEATIPLEPDVVGNRSNDAKCDPRGRLWAGTMRDAADAAATPSGALYRIEHGVVARILDGIAVSNGLGWSPDARHMYYVDTPTRRIDVLDYDVGSGEARNRRPLLDVRDFPGTPDGLAVDSEGCLWVAFYDGSAVHRFSSHGEHLATIAVPVARATSCAFASPTLDRLVITTAADPSGDGGDLYVCAPGIAGLPVAAYDG
jgi:sugar lactone lactonase YvrE